MVEIPAKIYKKKRTALINNNENKRRITDRYSHKNEAVLWLY
jgi:hypothetical protein